MTVEGTVSIEEMADMTQCATDFVSVLLLVEDLIKDLEDPTWKVIHSLIGLTLANAEETARKWVSDDEVAAFYGEQDVQAWYDELAEWARFRWSGLPDVPNPVTFPKEKDV